MRIGIRVATLILAATGVRAQALPPAAADLVGNLSPLEAEHLAVIQRVHAGGAGLIRRFREAGLFADSAEWFVAGPPEILPFAGSWHGLKGLADFQQRLDSTMRYDKVELREYLVSGNNVAAIFYGEGIARATGRPFHSEILRLYTFRDGKVIRVRNYYDTASYVSAVRGER